MLNVLQLIPTLDRSGAEKQMVILARGLPRDRFRVEVAALTRLGPLEAELREAGIPVASIGKRLKVDPLAFARLMRLLWSRKFDVVQTWIFAANMHGRVAAPGGGAGRGHRRDGRRPLEGADRAGHRPPPGAVDRLRGGQLARGGRVLPQGGRPRRPPGDDPLGDRGRGAPEVEPAEVRAGLGLPGDAPVVLFVGRLAAQKGVADLIAALDLLQHVRPDLRALIVGDGPLRSQLEETAHAFRLDGAVRFLGHRDDVPRLLAAADLLVLPSLYEGLPNVVLEAMRARKPVVATAAPGTTEVIADGRTGLLVPVHDPTALARAIRTVVEDPALALRLGAEGRARVESEFRADAMISQFAELYERLARAKGLAV